MPEGSCRWLDDGPLTKRGKGIGRAGELQQLRRRPRVTDALPSARWRARSVPPGGSRRSPIIAAFPGSTARCYLSIDRGGSMHVLAQEAAPINVHFGSFENTTLWVILLVSLGALAFAYFLSREVLAAPEGTETMKRIARAIQEGDCHRFRVLPRFHDHLVITPALARRALWHLDGADQLADAGQSVAGSRSAGRLHHPALLPRMRDRGRHLRRPHRQALHHLYAGPARTPGPSGRHARPQGVTRLS